MSPTARKQAQRSRDRAQGIKPLYLRLSEREKQQLKELCEIRGGINGEYPANELVATLIRKDHEKLLCDLSLLGECQVCGKQLPEGCRGSQGGDSNCWHHPLKRQLLL